MGSGAPLGSRVPKNELPALCLLPGVAPPVSFEGKAGHSGWCSESPHGRALVYHAGGRGSPMVVPVFLARLTGKRKLHSLPRGLHTGQEGWWSDPGAHAGNKQALSVPLHCTCPQGLGLRGPLPPFPTALCPHGTHDCSPQTIHPRQPEPAFHTLPQTWGSPSCCKLATVSRWSLEGGQTQSWPDRPAVWSSMSPYLLPPAGHRPLKCPWPACHLLGGPCVVWCWQPCGTHREARGPTPVQEARPPGPRHPTEVLGAGTTSDPRVW